MKSQMVIWWYSPWNSEDWELSLPFPSFFIMWWIHVYFSIFQLIFSVEKSMNRKRLWSVSEEEVSERVILHICSSTKKYLLFRCLWLMSVVQATVLVLLTSPHHPQRMLHWTCLSSFLPKSYAVQITVPQFFPSTFV